MLESEHACSHRHVTELSVYLLVLIPFKKLEIINT